MNVNNVQQAISIVKPAGVDSHTGVEDKQGNKDPELVKKFTQNAIKAFNLIKRASSISDTSQTFYSQSSQSSKAKTLSDHLPENGVMLRAKL